MGKLRKYRSFLFRYKKYNWAVIIFSILIIIASILFMMRPPTDPDLGWHLRNGNDILNFGILYGDLYSHTMFGYQWIAHEWLSDVFLYLGQKHLGFFVLSILFACIVFLSYYISARVSNARVESTLMAVLVATIVGLSVVGIRIQALTLLGIAITIWILFKWKNNVHTKAIYWLIPLMLIWVNMHGGFAAGLFLMGAFWFIELVKYILNKNKLFNIKHKIIELKHLFKLLIIIIVSFAVTFINPYTWRIYEELFSTIFNAPVKSWIAEWLPVTLSSIGGYNFAMYTLIVVVFLLFTYKKVDSTKIFLGLIFFFISIGSWRHMPLFTVITLPLLTESIEKISPKAIYYYIKSSWVIVPLVALVFWQGYGIYKSVYISSVNPSSLRSVLPYGAVQYIKKNNPEGKLFNEYNWGGYLVWNLPQKQVFIDGRMAIWQTEDQNLFRDYIAINPNVDEHLDKIIEEYDIGLALVYTNNRYRNYFLRNSIMWPIIYMDNTAMLFQRHDLRMRDI